MSSSHVDRNLLFGFLALQCNFISHEDLIAAVSVWLTDKSRPLDEILNQRRALADDERLLLEALVRKHLEKHGNDAERSLIALATAAPAFKEIKELGDPEIAVSLIRVSGEPQGQVPQFAKTLSVNPSQSSISRYRIMRPHAKGGLGQVYVAKDMELNRDVALKEIQLHRADDPDNRARFILEAEITGGLEHPGIVPVYGLGQYADGRPFYAMRFIRGDSFKEAIDKFQKGRIDPHAYQSSAFRNLISRFIAVCYSIDYAHSRGVIHRDLKPGNIMLGKYGEALVVDWGLARATGRKEQRSESDEQTLHPRSASGSAGTQMGSAIGTPAYMSPEQAAGKLDDIGPASDVYSLGATLYTILTGKLPFVDGDQGMVLRKVERGEFSPPRQVQSATPKPLEAICLNAMALNPKDRYATSAALAADLERWLADEPISALRETWPEHVRRWGRRHRGFVQSTAAAIVVIAAVSTAAAFTVNRARQEEANAKRQAQELYLVAQSYLDRWLPGVNEVLRFARGGTALRQRLLESAADEYQRLANYKSLDPRMELERGRTMLRLGDARRNLGNLIEADSAFQSADAHFEQFARLHPALADAARVEQGRARNRHGAILADQGNPEAVQIWRSTVKLLELTASDADIDENRRVLLASARISVAEWLENEGQLSAAQSEVTLALEALPQHATVTTKLQPAKNGQILRVTLEALRQKARILSTEGKWNEARSALALAVSASQPLLHDENASPSQVLSAADVQIELAGILRRFGSSQRELDAYAEAESGYLRLIELAPDSPEYREALALTLLDRSQLLLELFHTHGAGSDSQVAMGLLKNLRTQYPEVTRYEHEFAALLEVSGRLAHLTGDDAAARDSLQKAVDLLDKLTASRPEIPDYLERAAVARVHLARTLASLRELRQAEVEFESASSQLNDLSSIAPNHPQFAENLAWLHIHRGGMFFDFEMPDEAASEFRQAILLWTQIGQKWPSPTSDRTLAELLANCPAAALRDPARASVLAKRAWESTESDILARSTFAASLYRAGILPQALDQLEFALRDQSPLAKDCFIRSLCLQKLGDFIAAQKSFDQGLAIPQIGDEATRRLATETANSLGLRIPD